MVCPVVCPEQLVAPARVPPLRRSTKTFFCLLVFGNFHWCDQTDILNIIFYLLYGRIFVKKKVYILYYKSLTKFINSNMRG